VERPQDDRRRRHGEDAAEEDRAVERPPERVEEDRDRADGEDDLEEPAADGEAPDRGESIERSSPSANMSSMTPTWAIWSTRVGSETSPSPDGPTSAPATMKPRIAGC